MKLSAPQSRTLLASGVALAATVTATVAFANPPADAATRQVAAYGGNAYGSHVTLGTVADVGRTASTPLCTTRSGVKALNRTARTNLGAAGYIGAVTAELRSKQSGSTKTSLAATHTAYTSLLTGVIKLSAVTTSAAVSNSGSRYRTTGASTFVGLTIAGKSFPERPKANSKYALPGIGSLTLNGQHLTRTGGVPAITVTAFNLKLNGNNVAGLPAGQIIIGRSTASLRITHRLASGSAFATQISVAKVAGSGKSAAVYTPCGGTGNATRSNNVAGVTVPRGVAKSQAAGSSVRTTDTSAKTTSTSQNRIADLSLLSGMIKVHLLTTRASVTVVGSHRTTSAKGTSILGLVVKGKSVAAPRMGQQRTIPGVGTLSFGSAHKTSRGLQVYGLRLVLGSAHNGVPAGAVITIGSASAAVSLP